MWAKRQAVFDGVRLDKIKQKKEDAQKILDDLKAAGSDGDLNEIAKSVDDSYSSVSGTFDVNEDAAKEDSDEESDSSSSSSAYPDEVMKVLRTLKDGEIGPDVIETDTSYYVVKLDKVNDEDETVIITRKDNKNVVLISQNEYNNMLENIKILKDPKYLIELYKSLKQLENSDLRDINL